MHEYIFKLIFVICFVAGCVIRAVSVIRVRRYGRKKPGKIAGDHKTVQEKFLLFFIFLGMQVSPFIYILTSWLDTADYHLPGWAGTAAGMGGTVVFIAALWLLWRSQLCCPNLRYELHLSLFVDFPFQIRSLDPQWV